MARQSHGQTYRERTKPWYGTQRWKNRRDAQLAADPICAFCIKRGIVAIAKVADHTRPHKGDETLFWQGELQSLCKPCHDGDKQRIENGGKPKTRIGPDGWPEE